MDTQSTIVERLGNVVYWSACLVAPLAGAYGFSDTIRYFTRANTQVDSDLAAMVGLFYCISIYLLGVAVRYVLTGQGIWSKKSRGGG